MLPLHGIAFFGFNALRSLSIIATELVLATTVFVMVLDGREYNAAHKTPSEDYTDCEYYPGTDVPTHVWGIFWVQLDRTFILILLILCTLSEINWGGKLQVAFEHCLPILGRGFGTGCLGALQMMVATNLLAHYLEDLPLVTAWLLAIVGLINFHFGLIFRQPQKDFRSMSPARRAIARGDTLLRRVGGTAQFKPTLLGSSDVQDVQKNNANADGSAEHLAAINQREMYEQAQHHQQKDIMRTRARQDNAKAELLDELRRANNRDGSDTTSIISGAFLYDNTKPPTSALGHPRSRKGSTAKVPMSRQPSMSQYSSASMPLGAPSLATTVWPQPTGSTNFGRQDGANRVRDAAFGRPLSPRSPNGSCVSMAYERNRIKRKSLALARAARKRLSTSASRSRVARPAMPRLDTLPPRDDHMARAIPKQAAQEWERLESLASELRLDESHNPRHFDLAHRQPSPAYEASEAPFATVSPVYEESPAFLPAYQPSSNGRPNNANIWGSSLAHDHSLPIAGRFQSEWTSNDQTHVPRERGHGRKPSYKL